MHIQLITTIKRSGRPQVDEAKSPDCQNIFGKNRYQAPNSDVNGSLLGHSTRRSDGSAGHRAGNCGARSDNTRSGAGLGDLDEVIVRVTYIDRSDRTATTGTHGRTGDDLDSVRTQTCDDGI